MPVTLLLQGIADILRSGLILGGADIPAGSPVDSTETII
jgi:hypothetical protein